MYVSLISMILQKLCNFGKRKVHSIKKVSKERKEREKGGERERERKRERERDMKDEKEEKELSVLIP